MIDRAVLFRKMLGVKAGSVERKSCDWLELVSGLGVWSVVGRVGVYGVLGNLLLLRYAYGLKLILGKTSYSVLVEGRCIIGILAVGQVQEGYW